MHFTKIQKEKLYNFFQYASKTGNTFKFSPFCSLLGFQTMLIRSDFIFGSNLFITGVSNKLFVTIGYFQ